METSNLRAFKCCMYIRSIKQNDLVENNIHQDGFFLNPCITLFLTISSSEIKQINLRFLYTASQNV